MGCPKRKGYQRYMDLPPVSEDSQDQGSNDVDRARNLVNSNCVSGSGWVLHTLPASNEVEPASPLPNMDAMHHLPTGIPTYSKSLKHRQKKLASGPFSQGSPIKALRASKQYIYDSSGQQYLDCINSTAHVGHCHPQVVAAGQGQLGRVTTAQGFLSDNLSAYVKELLSHVPESLSVCYLCNSGSEANDLAIRLSNQYTGNKDLLVHEGTYHGCLSMLVDISPKVFSQIPNYKPKDHIHVLPLPNAYNGKFFNPDLTLTEEETLERFEEELEDILKEKEENGIKLSAFIFDPFLVIPGLYKPSVKYMKKVCKLVRKLGGLVIADEVQTGLGRTGDSFWGFQAFDIVPDIITVGKPLGNGQPLAAVICTKEVSDKLGGYFSTFGGNPVACAMGLAVLDVIYNERLISSAKNVGRLHGVRLNEIKAKFPDMLGDVRGLGLVWALEFVEDAKGRIPSPELALNVMFGLKSKKIVVGITGDHRNIVVFTPPMCFTVANSRNFCDALEDVLSECANSNSLQSIKLVSSPKTNEAESSSAAASSSTSPHRKRLHDPSENVDGNDSSPEETFSDDEESKKARMAYEALD